MQIVITTTAGKTFTLEVNSSDTVETVKDIIQQKLGFPPYDQRLILQGHCLQECQKLSKYNIQDGSSLYLMHPIGKTSSSTIDSTTEVSADGAKIIRENN